ALLALAQAGPAGEQSRAQLVRALKPEDPDVRLNAALALAVGAVRTPEEGAVAAALLEGLGNPTATARQNAARAIRSPSGKAGATAVEPLLKLLADAEPAVREEAATTLANFGEHADRIVPAVRALHKHDDPDIRATAVGLLGNYRFGLRGK